eukprot:TRINITY_DN717_c0_g1_i2.p2 TRINITY_DN717_c0_g1~~TRINITY_DN717_c0_g1_i2.p2  ORF type:complete len:162 (-),score=19.08 TRINITY_DN717_c0_g1_i2:70-555(-)
MCIRDRYQRRVHGKIMMEENENMMPKRKTPMMTLCCIFSIIAVLFNVISLFLSISYYSRVVILTFGIPDILLSAIPILFASLRYNIYIQFNICIIISLFFMVASHTCFILCEKYGGFFFTSISLLFSSVSYIFLILLYPYKPFSKYLRPNGADGGYVSVQV